MKGLRILILTLSLGMALLVAVDCVSAQEFGKVKNWEWTIGAPPEMPEASAVILYNKGIVEINWNYIITNYYIRMKVLTEDGIDAIATNSFSINRLFERCKKFKAQTLFPNGSKKEIDKGTIARTMDGNIETTSFAFPDVAPGCIVEYLFTVESKNFYHPSSWYFQTSLYTYSSSYTVALSPGFSYMFHMRNIPVEQRVPDTAYQRDPNYSLGVQDLKTYTWRLENLPPIQTEPFMRCERDYRSSMRCQLISYKDAFGGLKSFVDKWSDVGGEYLAFMDRFCDSEPRIQALADSLTAGLDSPESKSRALFDWVSQSIMTTEPRGAWFEHKNMSGMLNDGLDTRNAKNILLVELHRAIGMEAWPVLISTRDHGEFDSSFVSEEQFNVMLALIRIDNRYTSLDAASVHALYGSLPPECLVEEGLIVRKDDSQPIALQPLSPGAYRADNAVIAIDADGRARCAMNCEAGGYYAADLASQFDRISPFEFAEINFGPDIKKQLADIPFSCEVDSTEHFIVTFEGAAADIVPDFDRTLTVHPIHAAFRENPFADAWRFFPVDFTYPFVYRCSNEIILPKSAIVFDLPDNTKNAITGASYQRDYFTTDSSIIISTQLRIDNTRYEPFDYGKLRNFFAQYIAVADAPVILRLKK